MIDLLSVMQSVLREAGFVTRLATFDRSSVVCFEDDALMGFGCAFEDPVMLLERWRATEKSLLLPHAERLRSAGEKAWNVYCLFLCGASADPVQSRKVRWIEEDLQRTRKLAACGVTTREDLVRALLPILPLQYQPVLQVESVTDRLHRRIRTIAPKAADVVLKESVPAADVARLLGETL
jgi:hypothetical protein